MAVNAIIDTWVWVIDVFMRELKSGRAEDGYGWK